MLELGLPYGKHLKKKLNIVAIICCDKALGLPLLWMLKNLLFCLLVFRDQFALKCWPVTDLFQMFAVLVSDYLVTCSSVENKINPKMISKKLNHEVQEMVL